MNQFEKESLERILADLSVKGCRTYTLPLGKGYSADDGKRGIIILDLSIESHRIVYEISKVYKINERESKWESS